MVIALTYGPDVQWLRNVEAGGEARLVRRGRVLALNHPRRLHAVVPDAEQENSYQVPTIRYRGAGLVALSVAKTHCSLHLMSPPLARSLAGVLSEGKLSGATLQFDAGSPLSAETVRIVAERRMAEVDARLG